MAVTNIRKGIFETNSSSVHTLCINTKSKLYVPEKFVFDIGGEFGWQFESYYDSESCGQYFYILLNNIVLDKVSKEFKDSPECKELEKTEGPYAYIFPQKVEKYANLIKEYTDEYKRRVEEILCNAGCKEVIWIECSENAHSWEEGYIDHANYAYEFFKDLMNTPDLLVHFLFGGGSIHTGNDNDDNDTDYDPSADYTFDKGN